MFHSRKKFSGVILTEVLVALATLATGVIALGTITTSSISTTILSRDYLVAEGLVTEAVEIVKNIRDTNWLKKPNNKECWLTIGGACNLPVAGANYIPVFINGVWVLSNMGQNDLNLDINPPGFYQLFLDANQQYVYGNGPTKSKFSRSVKFTNVDNVNYDSATFEVKVQWKDGAKTQEIMEEVILHNSM